MTARYINPYTDFGFKKLFGEPANVDLLVDFLNSILPEHHQIAELEFQNTENLPDYPAQRRAFFDISCKSASGKQFIVEMQKESQHYFRDRAVFYSTFPIHNQSLKGKEWDFNLKPVYFVALLNFTYDEKEDEQKFCREVSLKDQDGKEFYKKLHYYFYQMPVFNKTESELQTQKDKWFYFLKNLVSFEDIPAILQEPVFEKAFQTAAEVNLTGRERDAYERDLRVLWDNYAVLKTATDNGLARGEAMGFARGHAAGHAAGRSEERIEIARSMKQEGLATPLIAKMTSLPMEEIERLP